MEYELSSGEKLGEKKIRVHVADDTRIHTQLLADVLRRDSGLHVVSSESGSEGLMASAKSHSCDVLIISSNLDEQPSRGFEVVREVLSACPDVRAVMLLDSSKREAVVNALRSGARGIFSKHESVDTLCKCVRSVYRGEIWANAQQMSWAIETLASSPKIRAVDARGLNLLSKRELEVVRGLAEGLTNREIAKRLGLSQHTVKNYLFRLFDKLGVSSRVELLFMTLNQDTQPQSVFNALMRTSRLDAHSDDKLLKECEKAAEQGIPAAQLALAQLCSSRRNSKDIITAYMWYIIASDQASRASQNLHSMMTVEQILEAKRQAADWLWRTSKIRPIGAEEPPGSVPTLRAEEASA
jgi:two-component system, NarL family, nitrate/nitrite response regulator NarL